MPLKTNKVPYSGGNKVDQPTLEPGGYPGRLVQVIDLGLQDQANQKFPDKKPAYMINLTYELGDEFCLDEEGNEQEDKPRWISEMINIYPLSSDKAKSTQRYRALDPQEEHEGDFSALPGSPVLINLVNNTRGDRTYTNVASLSPMRAKDAAKVPELVNPTAVFDLDEPDMEVFNSLPDFLKEKIKGNLEYKGSPLQKALEGEVSNPEGEEQADTEEEGDGEW